MTSIVYCDRCKLTDEHHMRTLAAQPHRSAHVEVTFDLCDDCWRQLDAFVNRPFEKLCTHHCLQHPRPREE